MRVGLGIDAHALMDGVRLVLGGVELDSPRGLAGHSDGDVIAHALIDAILGGAGLGDIGSLFPSGEPEWEGALARLAARARSGARSRLGARQRRLRLVGEEPRIAPVRERDARAARRGARSREERVNVRATTTDGLGFTGRGEGLAAHAVALLDKP